MTTTMRETFVDVVTQALDTDPRLAVVLAEISKDAFAPAQARHPHRVLNVGIREQLMVSVGGGLALSGMRPVVHTYGPFLIERPFEQIKLDLGHQDVGAVLVSIGASYDDPAWGRTHQVPGDVALIDTLPGWTVHSPGHPDEVPALLHAALASEDRVYLRLSTRANTRAYAWGPGFTTLRRGRRGVVLAVGTTADAVLEATADLDVTVLYAATVRPFDGEGLRRAVAETDRPDVVLVEPYLRGTSALAVGDALRARAHRLLSLGVGREHEVRNYGSPEEHDVVHGLDAGGIRKAVREFLG
ncbi:transketolase [Crossiella equi]|uniref:Transketolase n=1 Tax=Crossiella equi TaxID=130796 RepID=A0ABS5AM51_9PSEU|nr:transketolase [Crossiella equi]MBP2477294.1 transketolase [Crossiella equi]